MFIALYCMIGYTVSPGPRLGHESVVVNDNKLLVWGGGLVEDGVKKMLSRCECFTMDLHSQQWSQNMVNTQDEPTPCVDAECAVINNTVYSFGGWSSNKGRSGCLNETVSLDCAKMTWKKLEIKGDKPTARRSCGLCAVGEKLVMYGGMISHTDRMNLPGGVQYKDGYVNDCWEFCPHESNTNVVYVRLAGIQLNVTNSVLSFYHLLLLRHGVSFVH